MAFSTHPTLSFAELRKLHQRSHRRALGVFLAEGKKVIAEAAQQGIELRQVLATRRFIDQNEGFAEQLGMSRREITEISEGHCLQLSGTVSPPGVFAVFAYPRATMDELSHARLIVAFDGIRDPGNLGAMLRTADWFGVEGILISADSVDPYHDKVLRAAMGSVFHLPIVISDDLVRDLRDLQRDHHFAVVVTRPEVEATFPYQSDQPVCMVMGSESEGTSPAIDAIADGVWSLPKFGRAESLNVAVSFGIFLAEVRRARLT